MEKNRKTTRSAGRPAIGGKRRQYVVTDDAHEWIMAHGGGKYLTDTIHAIMAVAAGTEINLRYKQQKYLSNL